MEKQNFTNNNYSLPITCFIKPWDKKNFNEIKKKKSIENQIKLYLLLFSLSQ